MRVAIAGGAGYIGSHLASRLLLAGHTVTVLDSQEPVGIFADQMVFSKLDLRDELAVAAALQTNDIEGLFHLGSPSVMEESFGDASVYINEALSVAKSLARGCKWAKVKSLVFSSSCSVYGERLGKPASELTPLAPMSPYAQSKVAVENVLDEFRTEISIGVCRFFNVVGVDHDAGLLERHSPETHILPKLVKANLEGREFTIFGNNFPTQDGTAVRDYVDVRDISAGLSLAMKALVRDRPRTSEVWNLGMEVGTSVLSLVQRVEQATGKKTNLSIQPKREGDPASISASATKAKRNLGWRPAFSISESIESVVSSLMGPEGEQDGGS